MTTEPAAELVVELVIESGTESPTLGHNLIPDAQQQAAIDHPLAPLRIVAGAGSGKTEVMAQRVVALVERGGVSDHQVLGLTFSNKAAANLRDRIVRRLGPANRVHVATYHGFGAQLVGENAVSLGLPTHPRLLDRARAYQLLLDEFHRVDLPSRKLGRPENIIDEALTLASSCADHLVSVKMIREDCEAIVSDRRSSWMLQKTARSRRDLCVLLEAYAAAKRRLGYIDYGDQIALAVQVLRDSPEVVLDLRHRYRAVLLDEFQDTNVAQRELLKMVWVDPSAPGRSPITAVGDDLQAIYGFRGAHVHNLTHFDDYVHGTTSIELETNYRSGDSVVQLANHVQASLPLALPKTLRAHTDNASAEVTSFVAADDRDEAVTIAAQISSVGGPWNAIAVLCRKRRLIAPIAEALHEAGIPVEIVGIGGLLSRPEIVDVVAWLQVVGLPEVGSIDRRDRLAGIDPNAAVLRLLQGRRFRLGLRDLAALSRADRLRRRAAPMDASVDSSEERSAPPVDPGLDLRRVVLHGELPEVSVEAWQRLITFRGIVERLTPILARRSFVDVVETVIGEAGLWTVVDERGHENLLRFLHIVQTFAPLDGPITIAAFLEYLELVMLSEDEPAEATSIATDAVQIMTIHQAKGLEFTTVFVPGLAGAGSSRIFPDYRSTANGVTVGAALPHWLRMDNDGFAEAPQSRADEERLKNHVTRDQEYEERRLLYVAITRARERLIVSAAHWYSGPQKPQGPSEFYALLAERSDVVRETSRAVAAVENPLLAARRRQHDASQVPTAKRPQSEPTSTDERSASITGARRRARVQPETSLSLFDLRAMPASPALSPLAAAVAVTALVTYAQCPQRFAWSYVTPLPRRSSAAARLGTAVHRWIEERASGQLVLGVGEPSQQAEGEADDMPDPRNWGVEDYGAVEARQVENDRAAIGVDDESAATYPATPEADPGATLDPYLDANLDRPSEQLGDRVQRCRQAFLDSPFASLTPVRLEALFALVVTNLTVIRGRIDAAYERDGRYEIVDFKTGRKPAPNDASFDVQLGLYALVAVDLWGVAADRLRTSYCYLAPDDSSGAEVVSTDWTSALIDDFRQRSHGLLRSIEAGRFSPHGGAWCRGCDFASFCNGAQK